MLINLRLECHDHMQCGTACNEQKTFVKVGAWLCIPQCAAPTGREMGKAWCVNLRCTGNRRFHGGMYENGLCSDDNMKDCVEGTQGMGRVNTRDSLM